MRKYRLVLGICCCIGLLMVGCGSAEEGTNENGQGADSLGVTKSSGEPFEATFQIANAPDSFARVIGTIGSTNFLIDSLKPINGNYHHA